MKQIDPLDAKLIDFYNKAYKFVDENFNKDIKWAENLVFAKFSSEDFLYEYVWVVLCSGFSVNGARSIFNKWRENISDVSVITHPLKRRAVKKMLKDHKKVFDELASKKTNEEKLEYLTTLDHIAHVTKYHLAKNLGMDVAKPDVHLMRIVDNFGFLSVKQLCELIRQYTGHSIPVIDIVLWRYCQQNPDYKKEFKK